MLQPGEAYGLRFDGELVLVELEHRHLAVNVVVIYKIRNI